MSGRSPAAIPSALLLLLAGAALTACSEPGPPTAAEQALLLFDLSGREEPDEERLAACFDPLPDGAERAALLDALEALAQFSQPRVVAEQRAAELSLAVVDLTASLPGGGSADCSVHLEGSDETGWIVRWFGGPGVEWPRHRRPRGEALTSSPSPN